MVGFFWFFMGIMSGLYLAVMSNLLIKQASTCSKSCEVVLTLLIIFLSQLLNVWAYVSGRHVPRRFIGPHAKLALHLTTLFAAILFRLCLGYNWDCYLLVSTYLQLLAVWKLLWGVIDINFWDALIGALMQIAVCKTSNETFIQVLLVSGAVILCRYLFYSTHITCLDLQEELERPQVPV